LFGLASPALTTPAASEEPPAPVVIATVEPPPIQLFLRPLIPLPSTRAVTAEAAGDSCTIRGFAYLTAQGVPFSNQVVNGNWFYAQV